MNASKQLSRLLPRDGYLCGSHLGGCRQQIKNRADATVDHMFTRSFLKNREGGIRPSEYNKDWNCQPMHHKCNQKRGGQIYGFPMFSCSCHWLQIRQTAAGHTLDLHCLVDGNEFVIPVSSEGHSFVLGNISTGKFKDELGSMAELQVAGVWTMGDVPPGKKAITGKGHMGHAFPRVFPDEVPEFNRLEQQRIHGDTSGSIETFNRRLETARMKVYWQRAP